MKDPSPSPKPVSQRPPADGRVRVHEVLLIRVRQFLDRQGHRLWWLHSTWALCLGVGVILFARKGFDHARWLVVSLVAVWALLVVFFRLHGSGTELQRLKTAEPRARLRFLAMTYALKDLYQGMLFFLLPFYFQSATFSSANVVFFALLCVCAAVSTLDLIFDRVLMRWKAAATVFYGVTLFGALNLVVPALLPATRTLWTLLVAASVATLASVALNVPAERLRRPLPLALALAGALAAAGLAFAVRHAVPPVPMYLAASAVGPGVLADGRIDMEVTSVHAAALGRLLAVTDVALPGGRSDRLLHVWRHDGRVLFRAPESTSRVAGPRGTLRLRSSLAGLALPARCAGAWSVDVETLDGQLVGRTRFIVHD